MPKPSRFAMEPEDFSWGAICTQPNPLATVASSNAAFSAGTEKGKKMAFPPAKKPDAAASAPKPEEPKPGGDAPPAPETPKPDEQAPADGAGDAAGLKKIIAALAKRGLMVMGANVEQLAVSIETAVATAEGIEQKNDEKDKPDLSQQPGGGAQPGGTPTPSAPEPNMAMSQADYEALKVELASEKQARLALSQDLAQRQAAELMGDVNALEVGGYLDKTTATQRRELIGAKALSLVTGDDPEIRDLRITIKAERSIAAKAGLKADAAGLLTVRTGAAAMSQAAMPPANLWGQAKEDDKKKQEEVGAMMAKL